MCFLKELINQHVTLVISGHCFIKRCFFCRRVCYVSYTEAWSYCLRYGWRLDRRMKYSQKNLLFGTFPDLWGYCHSSKFHSSILNATLVNTILFLIISLQSLFMMKSVSVDWFRISREKWKHIRHTICFNWELIKENDLWGLMEL